MSLDPFFKKTALLLHADEIADPFGGSILVGASGESTTVELGTLYASAQWGTFAGRKCVSLRAYSTAYFGAYGAQTALTDGDFTIELWFYPVTTLTNNGIFGTLAGTTGTYSGCYAYYSAAGVWTCGVRGKVISFTALPALGQWHHLAIVSKSGVATVYLDGVRKAFGPIANNTTYTAVSGFRAGYISGLNSTGFDGYAHDLRAYKGVAKYEADTFTPAVPPVVPPSLYYESAKGKLISGIGSALTPYTTDSKFGGGCLRFDGASYLELAAHADWSLGTADFTMEAWVKRLGAQPTDGDGVATGVVLFNTSGASGGNSFGVLMYGLNLLFYANNSTVLSVPVPGGWPTGWFHLAVVRLAGTIMAFIDGVLIGTTTYATAIDGSARKTYIGGRYYENASYLWGAFALLDDVRITPGVARYTGEFVPPTAAFPNGQAAVSGVIRDTAGNPCARRLFVHSRATGRLLGTAVSDPITGVYEIAANELCYAVCLDAEGSYNAKVTDGIDPTV